MQSFNLKFKDDVDAQAFLVEIKDYKSVTGVTKDFVPTSEQCEAFIKSRDTYKSPLKDYRKAQAQKRNWRKNKGKIKRGIKAFHRSNKGKKFHRAMGRFLATRITRDRKTSEAISVSENIHAQLETLKALTSAKQHLFIELDYYHQMLEQQQLEELVLDHAIPLFKTIEAKIAFNEELTLDEIDFIIEMTDTDTLIEEFSSINNNGVAQSNEVWKTIVENVKNNDDYTDENFLKDLGSL